MYNCVFSLVWMRYTFSDWLKQLDFLFINVIIYSTFNENISAIHFSNLNSLTPKRSGKGLHNDVDIM